MSAAAAQQQPQPLVGFAPGSFRLWRPTLVGSDDNDNDNSAPTTPSTPAAAAPSSLADSPLLAFLLNSALLRVRSPARVDSYFRLAEVEFYYFCDPPPPPPASASSSASAAAATLAHRDWYCHRSDEQADPGRWYFHKQGPTAYKSGTRKGLDVTFGLAGSSTTTTDAAAAAAGATARGGILIRAIERVGVASAKPGDAYVEGPSLVVEALMLAAAAGVDDPAHPARAAVAGQPGMRGDVRAFIDRVLGGRIDAVWGNDDVDDGGELLKHARMGFVDVGCADGAESGATADGDVTAVAAAAGGGKRKRAEAFQRLFAPRGSAKSAKTAAAADAATTTSTTGGTSDEDATTATATGPGPLPRRTIYSCPRVGLVPKPTHPAHTHADRLRFLAAPYRFLTNPPLVAKGRPHLIYGLLRHHRLPPADAARILGGGKAVVEAVRKAEEGVGKGAAAGRGWAMAAKMTTTAATKTKADAKNKKEGGALTVKDVVERVGKMGEGSAVGGLCEFFASAEEFAAAALA
ncbi:hypothetical protein DFJ73DRAFT_964624 [Zopfochytrium polystomum]|nr:hypothetical protein DFJ73DRAFT_964624 [Zopfochytrium polystomum]